MLARNDVRSFLVLFHGRAGSTWLIDMLRQHPDVHAVMEQLFKYSEFEAQVEFIDKLSGNARQKGAKMVGFKEQLYNITEPVRTLRYLRNVMDMRFFILRRRNLVKQAISVIRGKQLKAEAGRFNVWKGMQEKLGRTEIDPEEFRVRLADCEAAEVELITFSKKAIPDSREIFYEDLLVDRNRVLREIWQDLGVEYYEPTTASVQKNTSDSLREAVVNFEELSEEYRNTAYFDMFFE